MTTPEQALQALYYTQWGLERIRLPFGGRAVQPSNWVPSKWSVRDMFGGDNWHLALACFQTGLGDEGWELLQGACWRAPTRAWCPGGSARSAPAPTSPTTATCSPGQSLRAFSAMRPDYPNRRVQMRPAFPSAWPKASIHTPDYAFDYRREGDADTYRLTLAREASVDFRLPVRAEQVRGVRLNGQEVSWRGEPGYGCTWVRLRTPALKLAEVAVALSGRLPQAAAVTRQGNVGDEIHLAARARPRVAMAGFSGVHRRPASRRRGDPRASGTQARASPAAGGGRSGRTAAVADVQAAGTRSAGRGKAGRPDAAGSPKASPLAMSRSGKAIQRRYPHDFPSSNTSRPGLRPARCVWGPMAIRHGRFAYWDEGPPADRLVESAGRWPTAEDES